MIIYTHEVHPYECDAMGITHHSNYIRFMEEARCHLLESLGYGYHRMEAEGVVSPVTALEVEYKKPTKFTDKIDIHVSLKDATPLKLTLRYEMKVGGVLVCRATSTHCFLLNGKPVSFQERWPALYDGIARNEI